MLHVAVALSIILGFLSFEFLGLLSGGMISAGYLAFFMEQPLRIVFTLAMAVVICLLVKLMQRWMIIFGRRRFMITIILGLIFAWIIENLFFYMSNINQDMRFIGYVIPGLIANDMEKQGILKTLAMIIIISIIIRLVLYSGILR